jgi:hypothetical protein
MFFGHSISPRAISEIDRYRAGRRLALADPGRPGYRSGEEYLRKTADHMGKTMMNAKPTAFVLAFALASSGITLVSAVVRADVSVIPVTGAEVTSQISGIVEIVNVEKRMLTIKTPDGRFEVIHVPAEAQRLDEVKIGNRLTITETEAVLIDLVKGDDAGAIGATQQTVLDQEHSAKPAGTMTDTLTLYGRIVGVDKTNRKVSVKGAEETIDFDIDDPALLDELDVGDGVVATFIRSVSGKVELR